MINSVDKQVFHQNLAPKFDANAGERHAIAKIHRQRSAPGSVRWTGRYAPPTAQIRDESRQKLSYSGTAFGYTNPMKTVTYRADRDGTILASLPSIKRGHGKSRLTGIGVLIDKRYAAERVDLRV